MKFKFILISLITIGVVIGGNLVKTPKMQKMHKMEEPEPVYRNTVTGGVQYPIVVPNNRNESVLALIDSSNNGYGMVATATRPIHVMEDGRIFMVYRQWAGEQNLHGRIGATFTDDDFGYLSRFVNVNDGDCTGDGSNGCMGRYPSALGNDDYPYAFWNEYSTPGGATYGGRGYYTYDEFGWGGESFVDPENVDLTWNNSKDHWVGSPTVSHDGSDYVFNIVYQDWTRNNYWFFHSEAYDDGFIVFGQEWIIFDEDACLIDGYNSAAHLSMNDDGQGVIGTIGWLAGADNGDNPSTNEHTPIFRLTDDHGANWSDSGEAGSCGYYYVPNEVWTDIMTNHFTDFVDECDPTQNSAINSMWTYYNADFKVDADGNPHILTQVLPCDDEFCYYMDQAGWYHMTVDRDNVMDPSAWEWSQVISMGETWSFAALDGDSDIWNTTAGLAFDKDNSGTVYVVGDIAVTGECSNCGDPDFDECVDLAEYPYWSKDIVALRSEDGGTSWSSPYNATETAHDGSNCPLGWIACTPDEGYPHVAQWVNDDKVYFLYQMPNWAINLIGDPLPPDHVNRVYGGFVKVDSCTNYDECGVCEGPGPVYECCDGAIVCAAADCTAFPDCNGECGGTAVADCLGVCEGTAIEDCAGDCEGTAELDDCEVCDGGNADMDCSGECFGDAVEDCLGDCGGAAVEDECGECDGPGPSIDCGAGDFACTEEDCLSAGSDYLVEKYQIRGVFPNPFNPSATIQFDVPELSQIQLSIFDLNGRLVKTLINSTVTAGIHTTVWNGNNFNSQPMPAGIYICKLLAGNGVVSSYKLALIK